ncbi:MAG: TonB family protein [Chitinispirillaceae bacterium]|nr:TonB family protein [Chitinispirillaceae bacterium]
MKPFVRIFLVVLVISGTVVYNWELINLRFEEIGYLLGSIASKDDASNTFGIVAKYELIKRRMTQGEEKVADYALEARIQALTSRDQQKAAHKKPSLVSTYLRSSVRLLVNGTRLLLGKPIVNTKKDDKIIEVLEFGYFWERTRKYDEAIKIYDNVVKTGGVDPAIKAAVLVHKAFCLSMQGNYSGSKVIYEQVINLYPNTEAGILAWKLLDFIEEMERHRQTIEGTDISGIEKAKQFYLFMDYRNAIKNLSLFLRTGPSRELVCEARYFKGRSHEELGETEDAIREYQDVVRTCPNSQWGKETNRRLLMLGEFYEQRQGIADEAKRQLEAYQDEVFLSSVGQYSRLVARGTLRGEILKDGKNSDYAIQDSLLNAILDMGELDLTGSHDAAVRQKKIDSLRAVIVERGAVRKEDTTFAPDITVLVMQNPARRPSIIKSVIDGNSNELRYIYTKYLRGNQQFGGRMVVEIKINANGRVGGATVAASTMNNREFEKEVIKAIIQWRFQPIADSVGTLSIKYPFEFSEDDMVGDPATR